MPSTTRSDLILQALSELFPDDYLEFTALSNGDSAATVVPATALRDSGASSNTWVGGWLYVTSGDDAGEFRRVTDYAPEQSANYGALTVARGFSGALAADVECAVYAGPTPVDELRRAVSLALRRLRRRRLLPLTLVSDGWMEDSGTSSWSSSSATLSKATSSASVYEGAQALLVDNSGAGGYAQSASIDAVPGEGLVVEAVVRVGNASGTHSASLVAYDVTNGADIDSVSTANRVRTRLRLDVTVPAGCVQVAFRLTGAGAATDAYWDEVVCYRPGDRIVPLPSDISERDQVVDVFTRRVRAASPSGEEGAYRAHDATLARLPGWELIADPTGATHYALDLTGTGWDGAPLVLDCRLPWPDLTTDSATTHCDRDALVAKVRAIVYERLARSGPRDDRKHYQQLATQERLNQVYKGAFGDRAPRPVGRRDQNKGPR